MALLIHRTDHPDLLVDALCDVITAPLGSPFASEIIAIPTRGIDRWLTQRIASTMAERGIGDGIAANIDFPFPHRFVVDVLSQIPETGRSIEALSDEYGTGGYGRFKGAVAEAIVAELAPIRATLTTLDDAEVARILQKGALDARTRAERIQQQARDAVGLGRNE